MSRISLCHAAVGFNRSRLDRICGAVRLFVSTATVCSAEEIKHLGEYPTSSMRNFAIMAHIDHGKSTLADRLLEITDTIPKTVVDLDSLDETKSNHQVLDTLKVERERGITVRAQSASMFYTSPKDGSKYLLNLIDTPGHVDFSSELLRSLLPSQGALLLVDAAQGIQAQTLSVFEEAKKRNLKMLGVVNKWDLVQYDDRGAAAVSDLASLLECSEDEILKVSAKTGWGVESVLEAIVHSVPAPPENGDSKGKEKMRALAFDSWYDNFRGVVSLVAVDSGTIKKGDLITSHITKKTHTVLDLGLMSPREVSIAQNPNKAGTILRRGMIGWVVCGMKDHSDAHLGDTFYHANAPLPPLETFKPLKSMVFAGVYPLENSGFGRLEEAIKKLTLTDRSVTLHKESSTFLGQGFRLGFNGSLHMDVFKQRLEDEFDEEVIITRPLVPIRVKWKNGKEEIIDNPDNFPEVSDSKKVESIMEPSIKATIIAPDEYTGALINLCTEYRGRSIAHTYLSAGSAATGGRVMLHYKLPLSSIITDFHSKLKSLTSGYASFDYEEDGDEESDLVKMNILVNQRKVDALCTILHRSQIEKESRIWVKRLHDVIPRQQYEVIIQAAIGTKVVARERVIPMRKDVTAGLYGGDYTRKMKHLAKQKEGKKRLKERNIGNVTIPTNAFYSVLGGDNFKRKGK